MSVLNSILGGGDTIGAAMHSPPPKRKKSKAESERRKLAGEKRARGLAKRRLFTPADHAAEEARLAEEIEAFLKRKKAS